MLACIYAEASIHIRTRIDTGVNTHAHMCRDVGIHRHTHTHTRGRVNASRRTYSVYTCDVCAQVWMHVYAYPYVQLSTLIRINPSVFCTEARGCPRPRRSGAPSSSRGRPTRGCPARTR